MQNKFKCSKCNEDLFENLGIIKFANNNFKVIRCLKCGNNIFLETKEEVSDEKSKELSKNLRQLSTKKLQK